MQIPAAPLDTRRVLVAGLSGSGKSTLAARLGAALGVPYVELDALHHGPGWVPRPEFPEDVARLAAGDAWVTEWQYDAARPVLAGRAQVLVWLDLPLRVTLARLVRRTVRRRVRGEVLWNGNTEPPLRTVLTDPEHVVRYMLAHRHRYHDLVPAALAEHSGLVLVRLRSARQVEAWLAGLRARPDHRPGAA